MAEIGGSCYVCLPYLEEDEKFLSDLEEIFEEVVIHRESDRPGRNKLKDIVERYKAVIIGTEEVMDQEIAEASENLETIGTLSTGLDHIDLESFEEIGVEVYNTESSNSRSVAEHTLALILGIRKKLMESHESVLKGKGRSGLKERPLELKNKKVGIIGAGSIARETIKLLEPFDMEIKVWTFNPEKHRDLESTGVELESDLAETIEESDIVSIHIPLSEKTENLINQEKLENIEKEKHRILINTSRAEIVETELLKNLDRNSVFNAAGLDVYPETLPETEREKILYTPHIAGITQESTRRMRDRLIQNLKQRNN